MLCALLRNAEEINTNEHLYINPVLCEDSQIVYLFVVTKDV